MHGYSHNYLRTCHNSGEAEEVQSFKKCHFFSPELPNTVVLGTTDIVDVTLWGTRLRDQEDALTAKMVPETQSYYPFALLGQEGWEALDPFLPMEVGRYTSQVIHNFPFCIHSASNITFTGLNVH